MIRIVLALLFIFHGIAHLVGFVVPWRLTSIEDAPYQTTLFSGQLDVGDIGIRIVGLLWLLGAIAFGVVGILALQERPNWPVFALIVSACSLVLCIIAWPEAQVGVWVNILIVVLLVAVQQAGWLMMIS